MGFESVGLNYDLIEEFNEPGFEPYGEPEYLIVSYVHGGYHAYYQGMEFPIVNLASSLGTGLRHNHKYLIQLFVDRNEEGVAVLLGE